jgi:hypothetical protein
MNNEYRTLMTTIVVVGVDKQCHHFSVVQIEFQVILFNLEVTS